MSLQSRCLALLVPLLASVVCAPLRAQAPAAANAADAADAAAARADALRFDILAFNVSGNTLLSVTEVEAAVLPFLGEGRDVAAAESARAALERVYQGRGYLSVVVSLPQQSVADGEITLEVIEAKVASRRITGAMWTLPSTIAARTPSVQPGSTPNFEALQAELGRLQSTPDLRLTPVVTPGRDPRQINVELKVEDSLPLHGAAEISSKQSYNTARGRLDASLRYDNLFQRGHSLGATWIVSPTDLSQSNTRVFSYAAPVGADLASRLSATLVSSDSETASSLGGATVVQGETLGLRVRMPLRAAYPALNHAWSLGLDHKRNRDRTHTGAGALSGETALRYSSLSVGYELFHTGSGDTQTTFDSTLSVGPSGLNARQVDCNGRSTDQFACKRAGATPDFQLLRLNATHQMPLWGPWRLQLRAQAQLAPGALTSGEQFGAGGLDSVRGYFEYEQVGDQGLVLGAELSSPKFWSLGSAALHGLLFGEGAVLRVNEALAAEQAHIRMASVGAGLRLTGSQGLRVALDLAVPLQQTLKADSSGALQPASGQASRNKARVDLIVRQAF
jgi:hemolysin activation/secretion protein